MVVLGVLECKFEYRYLSVRKLMVVVKDNSQITQVLQKVGRGSRQKCTLQIFLKLSPYNLVRNEEGWSGIRDFESA